MVKRWTITEVTYNSERDKTFIESSDYEKLEAENRHLKEEVSAQKAFLDSADAKCRHLRAKLEEYKTRAEEFERQLVDQIHATNSSMRAGAELEKKLRDEDNACQEWRVIAEGFEKKLAEADKRSLDYAKQMATQEFELVEKLMTEHAEELSRLRDAVPGEVENALKDYKRTIIEYYHSTDCGAEVRMVIASNALRALIGSLITRSKELAYLAGVYSIKGTEIPTEDDIQWAKAYAKHEFSLGQESLAGDLLAAEQKLVLLEERVRGMLEEAWIAGADANRAKGVPVHINAAKAYAERKMKEGDNG